MNQLGSSRQQGAARDARQHVMDDDVTKPIGVDALAQTLLRVEVRA